MADDKMSGQLFGAPMAAAILVILAVALLFAIERGFRGIKVG